MDIKLVRVNELIEICLVYNCHNGEDVKKLIKDNFLEIIKGKMLSERLHKNKEEYIDSVHDSAKYIYSKYSIKHQVGILGELLFHSIMRMDMLKKYISTSPTIAFADCYQTFYKGFDGCYYCDNSIWLAEVKSKIKSSPDEIDTHNRTKLLHGSSQLQKEANDEEVNRWEKVKMNVATQLTNDEIEDIDFNSLVSRKERNKYNQIICSIIVCSECKFDISYIKSYIESLYHYEGQKIFAMCICQSDFIELINFIKTEIGGINE